MVDSNASHVSRLIGVEQRQGVIKFNNIKFYSNDCTVNYEIHFAPENLLNPALTNDTK